MGGNSAGLTTERRAATTSPREEFYNFERDPNALHNLINSPECQEALRDLRRRLLTEKVRSSDSLRHDFEHRITRT
jgi:hypothetical protein